MFADWVNKMDEPLDAIAEAVRKPVFCFPMLQDPLSAESGSPMLLLAARLPDVLLSREIARLFQTRATYRIAQGNIDGAIEDKLTLHRLGRQISQTGCLVQQLVGCSVENMANTILVGGNSEHPLTKQQIRRILEGLDALPPRTPHTEAYEWERFNALSFLQALARKQYLLSDFFPVVLITSNTANSDVCESSFDVGEFMEHFMYNALVRSANLNITYRRLNEIYDAMSVLPTAEFESMIQTMAPDTHFCFSCCSIPWGTIPKLLTSNGRGMLLANMFASLCCPAVQAFEEAVRRSECAENMQRLTLAVLLYELEHGKMPNEHWAEQIGVPAQYLSCPSNPSPEGKTTYALIREPATAPTTGDTVPGSLDTIILIELTEPVPFSEAIVSVDKAVELIRRNNYIVKMKNSGRRNPHTAGMNVGYCNGAVQFLSNMIDEAELLRMLGRE